MLQATAAVLAMAAMVHAETKVRHSQIGKMPDGAPVYAYTLTNADLTEVTILTYGGIVQSIRTRDRKRATLPIVLGFDALLDYFDHPSPYFGALVGRYANRIGGARF